MSNLLPIVAYGVASLREKSSPIKFKTNLNNIINIMYNTMQEANGIGLAAPQIGKNIRLFYY